MVLATASAAALPYPPAAARFQRLTTDDGLSQSTIMALAQDRQGLMWIGTQNGLNRYDGNEVRVFRPDSADAQSLSDNFVTSLVADPDGGMWVGTLDGLSRFDPLTERFTVYRHRPGDASTLPSDTILSLHRSANGVLWIGSEAGLSRWRSESAGFESWLGSDADNGLPDSRVTGIASNADGTLWLATPRGLVGGVPGSTPFVSPAGFPHPEAAVAAVRVDRLQRLWVGLDSLGLVAGMPGRWQTLRAGEADALSSDSTRSVLEDTRGRIWIGTDLGLDLIEDPTEAGLKVQHFRHHRSNLNSIGGGGVAALAESAEGIVWVGSWNSGVAWLSEQANQFTSYTPDVALTASFRNPSSITLLSQGNDLWVGTGEGLYRFDTLSYQFGPVGGRDTFIYYASQRLDDTLLFGHARGISMIEPPYQQSEPQTLPESLQQARVRRLWADGDTVWAAADPLGLARLTADLSAVRGLFPITRSVTLITPYDASRLLVSAYDGLYWFDRQTGELLHVHRLVGAADAQGVTLPSAVMAIARDASGRTWAASNGDGLFELVLEDGAHPRDARFNAIQANPTLADSALKALAVDAQGQVWMSTASGIASYIPDDNRFRNFKRSHGTLGRDYINASFARFEDGRIAFGGMDGFTVFDPARVSTAVQRPPIAPRLSSIEVNHRSGIPAVETEASSNWRHSGDGAIEVPAGGMRNLSLRFATVEFTEANNLRYSFRLDPFDAGWSEVDAQRRVAAYTNLEPGQYRFRVRAAYPDSSWSEETQLDIRLLPLWWQTPWAQLLGAMVAISLLFAAHRHRTRRIAEQSERLARLVAERTSELRERSQALQEAKNHAEASLRQLESTQSELVRAEKMAVLGQLVAGVAHEVNTPIGVALTAGTMLRDATKKITRKLEEGGLRKTELQGYFETVAESSSMVERNLDRAAHLISNFKQVSVDRTSDGRRRFNLAGYMREVLESLELMWKRRSIETRTEIPGGIVLDSFPGALGQVITNLTQNAVTHAFAGRNEGRMEIQAEQVDGDHVVLRFRDNGCGIPEANLARVFEPFFTTRRNEGGTGLGLHIVYNLVTQKLGGTVSVSSEEGVGTLFEIKLPLVAPK